MTKKWRSISVWFLAAAAFTAVLLTSGGPGAGETEALAAAVSSEEARPEEENQRMNGTGFVTEAKIQFGLLNPESRGQQLAGMILEGNVREKQRIQAEAQTEIRALQKQILMEKQEEEKRRKEEEERRAARKIPVSDEDYQILLRIVQAEAGGCDEKGKILVADVIINRVLSSRFPSSVKSVVYQRSQFQPVSNGRINSVKVTAETVDCVDRALGGEDYSQGALYFMNRKGAGSRAGWFDSSLTPLFSHDGHEFFK